MGRKHTGINTAPLDRFTAAHAAMGIAAAAMGVPLPAVLVIAVGWEVLEQPLKRKFPGRFPNPNPDSTKNAVWDINATVIGYAAGETMRRRNRRRKP